MAKTRPGASSKGGLGCLILFMIPFILFGGGFCISGVIDIFQMGFGAAGKDEYGKAIFGAVFLGFSLLFVWLGVSGQKNSLSSKSEGLSGDWQDSPIFPKLKRMRQGEKGMRLAPAMGPLGKTIGLGVIGIFWNGISYAALFGVLNEKMGWSKYLIIAFLSIFLLIGLLIIIGFFHQLFTVLLVGKTPVEISREPIRLGETFRVHIYQPGSFQINSVEVRLICKESATYQQGTNTRTDHHEIHDEVIGECGETQARRDGPVISCEGTVPDWGMHSMKAPHNAIRWLIQVKIDIPMRPDVKEEYEFRVIPETYS